MVDDEQQPPEQETPIDIPPEETKEETIEAEPEVPAEEESSEEPETSETPEDKPEETEPKTRRNPLKRLLAWAKNHKKLSIPLGVVLLLALITAIPQTRYLLPGTFYKANYPVTVLDSVTAKPVSNASVSLDGKTAVSDSNGKAVVKARLGKRALKITKKYYKDQTLSVTVGFSNSNARQTKVEATGRQVPITVKNKISGQAVANISIKASDTEATTDVGGKVTIVLLAGETAVKATLSGTGYNPVDVTIQVTEQAVKENDFVVTPAGKLYFLSKKSGKIDVVKTDLDGQNRQTIIAGTGNEEDFDTILLASRDWKQLALKAKRDAKPKLYLIDTATDKLSTIDEGDANFTPIGWYNDNFVYQVDRNGINDWQPKRQALKSYNATSDKIALLDETAGEGTNASDYAREYYGSNYILENQIMFSKTWQYSYGSIDGHAGKKASISSIRPDGTGKQTLKTYDAAGDYGSFFISAVPYGPQAIYYQLSGTTTSYLKYEASKLQDTGISSDTYLKSYPTFLISPSSQQTFWYESRDGKNTLLVGDSDGKNGKEVASLSDYAPYGWYGADYLLVSKNSSELYILPTVATTSTTPFKVSDYHKPNYDFRGYGYGYGGF